MTGFREDPEEHAHECRCRDCRWLQDFLREQDEDAMDDMNREMGLPDGTDWGNK